MSLSYRNAAGSRLPATPHSHCAIRSLLPLDLVGVDAHRLQARLDIDGGKRAPLHLPGVPGRGRALDRDLHEVALAVGHHELRPSRHGLPSLVAVSGDGMSPGGGQCASRTSTPCSRPFRVEQQLKSWLLSVQQAHQSYSDTRLFGALKSDPFANRFPARSAALRFDDREAFPSIKTG
ncbi:hypothetical protein [Ktedonospora formicarum]|uniref:hypothetical protein n=1 Tax=Ktedonospora formicarum TaxID=2778364 RepID=UPI001C689B90|nr:hypothetical protein [Ktedonospora formicarum]